MCVFKDTSDFYNREFKESCRKLGISEETFKCKHPSVYNKRENDIFDADRIAELKKRINRQYGNIEWTQNKPKEETK